MQHYKNVRIIVSHDTFYAWYVYDYMHGRKNIETIKVKKNMEHPYYWNLYCNDLKAQVKDGWFFFLDDDDVLDNPYVLEKMENLLHDDVHIFQFDRCGTIKPSNKYMDEKKIERGKIGMPCIVMHHSVKKAANFDGKKGADYRFIKQMSDIVEPVFNKMVLVRCDNHGLLGQME